MTVKNSDGVSALDKGAFDQNHRPHKIQYRRLRAPRDHGDSLQIPKLPDVPHLLQANKDIIRTFGQATGDDTTTNLESFIKPLNNPLDWKTLIQSGRTELIELARHSTSQYLPGSSTQIDDFNLTTKRIVMAGHQPKLFHPGVWFKNFALSRLGQSLNATAINLVVDNDICGSPAVSVPEFDGRNARVRSIPFDTPGKNIPFEARTIEDESTFRSFGRRLSSAIAPLVAEPIVNELWPLLVESRTGKTNLGDSLARGRHLLELNSGLRTLEVPLSAISQSRSFAKFACHLFENASEFAECYNQSLNEYRIVHRIRSRSHPVPALENNHDWIELPFWVWLSESPIRKRLFSRRTSRGVQLTDRESWQTELTYKDFVERFSELTSQGVAIRPKALLTTMYSRLVLSDLFMHGIGGAKYDQLTDAIVERFFGFKPPAFATMTATMKLPSGFDEILPVDITRIEQHLRELRFHPEVFADRGDPEVARLAKLKDGLVSTNPPKAKLAERHRNIEQCNFELQTFVHSQRNRLETQLDELKANIRTSQILGSREYSFCLFPRSLVDELRKMTA